MTDSSITISEGGTTFDGPDAVRLYQAAVIRAALKLLIKGIRPHRDVSLTSALKAASKYTGKTYKRSEAELAIADLTIWIETMKSAIPVINEDK